MTLASSTSCCPSAAVKARRWLGRWCRRALWSARAEISPPPRNAHEVVTFLAFLAVGMAMPFSMFVMAVLEEFAIHLVHLTPNAILTLALFSHAREMFVGLQSSVGLFCHFFAISRSSSLSPGPGATPQACTMGGVFFRRHSTNFFPPARWDK